MRYAQTGITAFSGVEGCPGHSYQDRADPSDPHMSVDCPMCEPGHLNSDPLWSGNPAEVPLTELEKRAADKARAEADQLASKSVTGAAAIISALAAQPGLLEGLGKLLSGQPQAPGAAVPAATAPAAGPVPAPEVPKPAAAPPARPQARKRASARAGTAS